MRGHHLALALCAVLSGCGNTVSVGNDNPLGTVGGVVLDAETSAPLVGAMVSIVSASNTMLTATSDMNGVWQVTKVPAGSFILTIAQANYVTAQFNATLGGNVGNFPVNNPALTVGPLGLIKNTGTFSVKLVDQNGAPAPGVQVVARPQARYVDFSSSFVQAVGNFQVSATSDSSGVVKFGGLPDYAGLGQYISDTLPIDVPPTKIMGTDVYSFLGLSVSYQVNHLTDPTPTIVLAGPKTALAVLTSNIDYLRTGAVGPLGSVIPVMGPISVAFNQAISPTSIRVSFQDDSGKTAPFAASATVTGNLVTVTPSAGFTPGMRYNLVIHAEAAQALLNNGQYDAVAPFFAQQTAGVNPSSAMAHVDPNAVSTLVITLNEAIGLGNGSSYPGGFTLSCVAFYENVNFDNGLSAAYQGEWVSGGAGAVVCSSTPPPAGNFDVTKITAVESAAPYTGFTRTFRVQFATGMASVSGCSSALAPSMFAGCVQPAQGTKVHLVFSRQASPSLSVHRVNGDTVGDDIVATIQP
jgi:hypothetical protein